ncbi:GNAT family N-acetyltransferase [Thalassospira xiamenensis]|uniref:GNAT family N-acetyltransferase n=1 Tax=Thalassospira xiamenensis TaxID=220697 RepID=UPI000DED6A34|nr:GNAT family protein [Thalassospira xiamenensis]RCK33576.1 hypothetical protein TH24_21245 [Thalassospira xiamenensis]
MLPPVLEHDCVKLVSCMPEDVSDKYLSWLSDPKVVQFTEIVTAPQSRDKLVGYVETQNRSNDVLFWRILLRGEHVGNLRASGLSGRHSRACIALIIGEDFARGKSVGSTAIRMATSYLFSIGLFKVTAGMYEKNKASLGAFLKAGYHIEAELKDHFIWNDHPTNGILVACFKPD